MKKEIGSIEFYKHLRKYFTKISLEGTDEAEIRKVKIFYIWLHSDRISLKKTNSLLFLQRFINELHAKGYTKKCVKDFVRSIIDKRYEQITIKKELEELKTLEKRFEANMYTTLARKIWEKRGGIKMVRK